MVSLSAIVLFGLAVWRITNILHSEKIAEPIRRLVGVKDLETYNTISIKYLFSCFMCLSVWVGFFCAVVYYIYPLLLLPFAGSALAVLINHFIWRD